MEAFAAGIPVIGSNLGGIAELVQHEVSGILVQNESIEGWVEAIHRCYTDRKLLDRLRAGICRRRGMDAVADEMLQLYKTALESHNN